MPQPVFHSSTVYGIVYDVVFLARKSLYKYHVIVIIICSMTTNVNSKGGIRIEAEFESGQVQISL